MSDLVIIIYRVTGQSLLEFLLFECAHCNTWMALKGRMEPKENVQLATVRLLKEQARFSSSDYEIMDGFQKWLADTGFDRNFFGHIKYTLVQVINMDKSISLSKNYRDFEWVEYSGFDDDEKCIDLQQNVKTLLAEAEEFLKKMVTAESNRKLIIVRHGERIDRTFPNWMQLAWNEKGCYKPFDLNMPKYIPERNSYKFYSHDSPLTEVGYFEAQSVGRSLAALHLNIDEIYSSPAYRCIQTATGILKSSIHSNQLRIKIEPGLFEFFGWYPELPEWFLMDDMLRRNFPVDPNYQPIITISKLKSRYAEETHEEFYQRCEEMIERILAKHPNPCNIVIVAHGPHLDSATRPLLKRSFDVPKERFQDFGDLFPFCSFVVLEEVDKEWTLITDEFPHFSYTNFSNKVTCNKFFNRP